MEMVWEAPEILKARLLKKCDISCLPILLEKASF